jgi:hypothetical protein
MTNAPELTPQQIAEEEKRNEPERYALPAGAEVYEMSHDGSAGVVVGYGPVRLFISRADWQAITKKFRLMEGE